MSPTGRTKERREGAGRKRGTKEKRAACRLTGRQAESMSSLARVVNCVVCSCVCVCAGSAHGPRGYREQAGGSALLPTPPTQTPLTTHRHGNQGAQEGDAGWADGGV